jgi:hypothetical protein
MRKRLILLIGVLIMSCNQGKKQNKRTDVKSTTLTEKSENFDWLLGKWKRINDKEGKETFENWKKIKETEYLGIGFTMQNGDTIQQENIRLIKTNGKWNLIVKLSEEAESITFNGVSHNENEFTCENNENDFPNKIKYWKHENKINAIISGGEMKILFEFEKLGH